MTLVHDPAAYPAWCEEHEDFAWRYSNGSGGCFYTCIVETGSSECRLVPLKPLELAVAKDSDTPDLRNALCVERWPECFEGGYDPRCCRFPKTCSCTVVHTQPSDTEEPV